MKKLMIKASIFILGLAAFLSICIVFSSKSELLSNYFGKITNSSEYSRDEVNGGPAEIIPSIEMVQKNDQYTKLVIGDSVCCGVFNGLRGHNSDYLMLGTNQAITLTGQYLLAEQFVEYHKDATDIYLIIVESSFGRDFDMKYGYQYAVMPFVETNLFGKLDKETIKSAEESYGKIFLNKRAVEVIDYSEMNRKIYLNLLYEYGKEPCNEQQFVSDNAIRNLLNLEKLCKDNNVTLHVLPAPMPDTAGMQDVLLKQKQELEKYDIKEITEKYYASVTLYPEEYFPDGTHPGGDYGTREELNKMILDLKEKSGELEGLILGAEDNYGY